MMLRRTWTLWSPLVLAAAALLVPFWPFAALAIGIAALSGRFALAVGIGLFFDIVYGVPAGRGFLHALGFPFALGAAALFGARIAFIRYLR